MAMIDLHSHTTASDGQHTPTELVRLAREAGITHLAVTDHDTLAGLPEAIAAARDLGGVEIVPGIEISTRIEGMDVHVLGHFVRPDDAALLAFTAAQEGERRARMERMVAKLNALGVEMTMADVDAVAGSDNLCRPHLARAMVERGVCHDVQEAFAKWIGDDGPAFSPHQIPEAAEAIALVHAAGGVASLAHPGCDDVDRWRIQKLKQVGLDGIEIFHTEQTPPTREKYLKIARELDLVPTAGSDFHGAAVTPRARLGSISLDPRTFLALRRRAH